MSAPPGDWPNNPNYILEVVMADDGTVTPAKDLGSKTLCGVYIPAGWVGTAMTFQASADGVTYVAVHNAAGAYSIVVAASKYVAVDPTVFLGVRYLKLVSGSTESGGPLTVKLAVRIR